MGLSGSCQGCGCHNVKPEGPGSTVVASADDNHGYSEEAKDKEETICIKKTIYDGLLQDGTDKKEIACKENETSFETLATEKTEPTIDQVTLADIVPAKAVVAEAKLLDDVGTPLGDAPPLSVSKDTAPATGQSETPADSTQAATIASTGETPYENTAAASARDDEPKETTEPPMPRPPVDDGCEKTPPVSEHGDKPVLESTGLEDAPQEEEASNEVEIEIKGRRLSQAEDARHTAAKEVNGDAAAPSKLCFCCKPRIKEADKGRGRRGTCAPISLGKDGQQVSLEQYMKDLQEKQTGGGEGGGGFAC